MRKKRAAKLIDLSGTIKEPNYFIEHLRLDVDGDIGKNNRSYFLPNYVASCCRETGIDGIKYMGSNYICIVLWKDDYFSFEENTRGIIGLNEYWSLFKS